MATYLQGKDVEFLVRVKDTGEFKRLVCEDTLVLEITNDVVVTKTKTCGTAKGIQSADFKANGSAVCNLDPTSEEVSYDGMVDWQLATTEVDWIIRNIAVTGYAAGEGMRFSGTGYFVSTQGTFSNGEACKWTWNLEGTGTINTTES